MWLHLACASARRGCILHVRQHKIQTVVSECSDKGVVSMLPSRPCTISIKGPACVVECRLPAPHPAHVCPWTDSIANSQHELHSHLGTGSGPLTEVHWQRPLLTPDNMPDSLADTTAPPAQLLSTCSPPFCVASCAGHTRPLAPPTWAPGTIGFRGTISPLNSRSPPCTAAVTAATVDHPQARPS